MPQEGSMLNQYYIQERREYSDLSAKFFEYLVNLAKNHPDLKEIVFTYMEKATNCFSLKGIKEVMSSFKTDTAEFEIVQVDTLYDMTHAVEFSPLTQEQINQYEQ